MIVRHDYGENRRCNRQSQNADMIEIPVSMVKPGAGQVNSHHPKTRISNNNAFVGMTCRHAVIFRRSALSKAKR